MLLALAMVCSLAAAALGWHRPAEAAECFGAQRRYVVPVGHTVGIKLFSRGVMVVGLADVATGAGGHLPGAAVRAAHPGISLRTSTGGRWTPLRRFSPASGRRR